MIDVVRCYYIYIYMCLIGKKNFLLEVKYKYEWVVFRWVCQGSENGERLDFVVYALSQLNGACSASLEIQRKKTEWEEFVLYKKKEEIS